MGSNFSIMNYAVGSVWDVDTEVDIHVREMEVKENHMQGKADFSVYFNNPKGEKMKINPNSLTVSMACTKTKLKARMTCKENEVRIAELSGTGQNDIRWKMDSAHALLDKYNEAMYREQKVMELAQKVKTFGFLFDDIQALAEIIEEEAILAANETSKPKRTSNAKA
jgi:hypothetical protein